MDTSRVDRKRQVVKVQEVYLKLCSWHLTFLPSNSSCRGESAASSAHHTELNHLWDYSIWSTCKINYMAVRRQPMPYYFWPWKEQMMPFWEGPDRYDIAECHIKPPMMSGVLATFPNARECSRKSALKAIKKSNTVSGVESIYFEIHFKFICHLTGTIHRSVWKLWAHA